MMRLLPYRLFVISLLALTGCTGMKHVTSKDPLYLGYELIFIEKAKSSRQLTRVANAVVKPEPNATLLWMRPRLARNNKK